MKTYQSIAAILAVSLGTTNLATAHPGGGGGFGGGGHFGGGGMHSSALSAPVHLSAPAAAVRFSAPTVARQVAANQGHSGVPERRDDRGRQDHRWDRNGYRGTYWGGDWPYYYGDSGDGASDYSTPYYNATDSTVVMVQKALARDGYYHGPIDGTLDLITQDAIAKYDRDHRLPVSHTINQPLLTSLRIG